MAGYQYRGTDRDTTPTPARKAPTVTPQPAPAPAKTFTSGPVPALGVKPRTLPVWEEPPTAQRGGNAYITLVIDQLKAHPGKWARVKEGLSNSGGASTWTKRGCEAATRKTGDGTYSVWARWPEGK